MDIFYVLWGFAMCHVVFTRQKKYLENILFNNISLCLVSKNK